MTFYHHYKNGFLPSGGGLLDQCETFSKAVLVIDSVIEEVAEEERRKLAAKLKKGKF